MPKSFNGWWSNYFQNFYVYSSCKVVVYENDVDDSVYLPQKKKREGRGELEEITLETMVHESVERSGPKSTVNHGQTRDRGGRGSYSWRSGSHSRSWDTVWHVSTWKEGTSPKDIVRWGTDPSDKPRGIWSREGCTRERWGRPETVGPDPMELNEEVWRLDYTYGWNETV